jgi:hypothetical protein
MLLDERERGGAAVPPPLLPALPRPAEAFQVGEPFPAGPVGRRQNLYGDFAWIADPSMSPHSCRE